MNLLPYFLKTKTQLHRRLMAGILSKLMSSGSLALHTDNAINSNNTVASSVWWGDLCAAISLFPHKNMLHYIMWILINMCSSLSHYSSHRITIFSSQCRRRSFVCNVSTEYSALWCLSWRLCGFLVQLLLAVNMCNSSSSWRRQRRLWHRYHAHERENCFSCRGMEYLCNSQWVCFINNSK